MSTASTPGATEFKPLDIPTGLQTPQSMSDDAVSDNLELADDEYESKPRNNKRKGQSYVYRYPVLETRY